MVSSQARCYSCERRVSDWFPTPFCFCCQIETPVVKFKDFSENYVIAYRAQQPNEFVKCGSLCEKSVTFYIIFVNSDTSQVYIYFIVFNTPSYNINAAHTRQYVLSLQGLSFHCLRMLKRDVKSLELMFNALSCTNL